MFGFVKPEQGTLLVKEYAFYKATYCGICRQMKAHTGLLSPIFLTYDSVFLALVRMVFEDKKSIGAKKGRCLAHPSFDWRLPSSQNNAQCPINHGTVKKQDGRSAWVMMNVRMLTPY